MEMSERVGADIATAEVVSRDENVHGGDLVFAGTRVRVTILTDYLRGGDSIGEFLENYPTIERRQADAFLELAPGAIDQMNRRGPRTS